MNLLLEYSNFNFNLYSYCRNLSYYVLMVGQETFKTTRTVIMEAFQQTLS